MDRSKGFATAVTPFPNFYGNTAAVQTLAQMIERGRISQAVVLSGPESVGKATLARRFAAALLGHAEKIEQDDLSLAANAGIIEERENWTAEKRSDDPLLFSTHPDFVTFAPDGPLRQISIQQMRMLRQKAQFKPLCGDHRVFLIDHLQRANEQAANSLLKILEEPPAHLVIIATAENAYDLLPTIRSRTMILQMARLSDGEMMAFLAGKQFADPELRMAISDGCPGLAARADLEAFQARRSLMLAAFECAAGLVPFSAWIQQYEPFSTKKSEKLDLFIKPAYALLQDILATSHGHPLPRNSDIKQRITQIAKATDFRWLERAVSSIDELVLMVRRNIQKTAALDAMIIKLRNQPRRGGA